MLSEQIRNSVYPFAAILILTPVSLWLVLEGAANEPYFRINAYDMITQVGLGTLLIGSWFHYIAMILLRVSTRRIPSAWLSSLLWVAIVLFYLSYCPIGYVSDIVKNHNYPAQQAP